MLAPSIGRDKCNISFQKIKIKFFENSKLKQNIATHPYLSITQKSQGKTSYRSIRDIGPDFEHLPVDENRSDACPASQQLHRKTIEHVQHLEMISNENKITV